MKLPGSALLLALLALSSLMILVSKQWFSTSLLYEVVLDKEKYEGDFWLLEGLLACSVQLCQRRWHDIQERLEKGASRLVFILQSPYTDCNSQLVIEKLNDESLHIHVVMHKEQQQIGEHSCVVTTGTHKPLVTEWKEWHTGRGFSQR